MSQAAAPTALPAAPDGFRDIPFPGGYARYAVPNQTTNWRVETFFEKERDTLAWIAGFQADDVFVDIGANVGMYAIWAAKTRGCKVFAFEPESQNYGLLNMNIYVNGVSEHISAYCMAIADKAGFDHFYLGQFQPGGSCHAFGAPLDPNLKQIRPQFRQGCFAAPLDEMVDAGVVPPPTHVKIDVDGLEHAVIAGMDAALSSPALKSVLVEINGNLEEHQAVMAHMAERGFHVDDRQRAASLQTEGFFAGAGNVIFWKDAAAALRLGAELSGEAPPAPQAISGKGETVAGLDADQALEAAMAAIANAPVQTEPTPYWYCDEVFPQDFYAELLDRFPPESSFTSITDLGWVRGDIGTEAQRGVIPFSDADIAGLPKDISEFWRNLMNGFRSERFALTMLRKFLPQMAERYGSDVGTMRFSAESMLLSDKGEYALGPHTDRPERVLAALFYMPASSDRPDLGTSLYLPKELGFTCEGGPHHGFENFVNVATMPYLPNSAFCFFKTQTSFHGVEPIPADAPPRRLLSYILETA